MTPLKLHRISINTGSNANEILSQEINQTFDSVCMEICRGWRSSAAAGRLESVSARTPTQTESFTFHLQFCLLTPDASPLKLCDFTASSDYVTNCEISLEIMSSVYYPRVYVSFLPQAQNMHIRLIGEM